VLTPIPAPQLRTPAAPRLSLGRRFDLAVLAVLLGFVLLYRLQFIFPWINDFQVRELLYAYLYFRLLVFYRPRPTRGLLLLGAYMAYAAFVGVHTYFRYDAELAVATFTRFVNVSLLGPLVAVMVTSRRDLLRLLKLWLGVMVLVALSGVYQVLGGDLTWMTQGYVSSRGEVLRYMTLIGEPNVGGMAAALVMLMAVYLPLSLPVQVAAAALAAVLMVLSVSKAALAGMLLALAVVGAFQVIRGGRRVRARYARLARLALAGLLAAGTVGVAGAALRPELVGKALDYGNTLLISFAGAGDRDSVSPGFFTDLGERLFDMTLSGLKLAQSQSDNYAIDVIIGSSYGIAGTAAEEIRGNDMVITAHNGFSETYFVGGLLMVMLFVLLLGETLRVLWRLSRLDPLYTFLLAALLVCLAFMSTYPVMSNIGLGSIFWLAVGSAANHRLRREALAGVTAGREPKPAPPGA
jgi:hypothetical protein